MATETTHRYPPNMPTYDVIAWKCAKCGQWQDDGKPMVSCPGSNQRRPCPGCWVRGEHGYERLVPLNTRHDEGCPRAYELKARP